LQIESLAVHPDGDVPDAGPRVEPGAQRPERAVVRGHRAAGKADRRRHQEPSPLVEHGYCSENGSVNPRNHGLLVKSRRWSIFIAARVIAALMFTR